MLSKKKSKVQRMYLLVMQSPNLEVGILKNVLVLVFCLIIMAMTLPGCSDSKQSNNIIDIDKPLTQSQIDEIITLTNEGLIKDIDYSTVTKPDPEEQAVLNKKFRNLGEKLKGRVTVENTTIIIAWVDGEAITLSDWYYEKYWESGKAENKIQPVPPDEEIFSNLLKTKTISSTARRLGLYPFEEQVNTYLANQKKCMAQLKPEEIAVLLEAWNISEDEYFLLMEYRFADSLAKANWRVYLDTYSDIPEKEEGYAVKIPLAIDDITETLLETVKVDLTPEGRQLGINY